MVAGRVIRSLFPWTTRLPRLEVTQLPEVRIHTETESERAIREEIDRQYIDEYSRRELTAMPTELFAQLRLRPLRAVPPMGSEESEMCETRRIRAAHRARDDEELRFQDGTEYRRPPQRRAVRQRLSNRMVRRDLPDFQMWYSGDTTTPTTIA